MKPKITFHENGQLKIERWKDEEGWDHKLDGPAWREWYEDGQLKGEVWCVHGDHHRLDGPAVQSWSNTGQLTREEWRINNIRHRLDGPAERWWNSIGKLWREVWFINGVQYETEAEFQVAADLYKANEIAELF